MLCERGQRGAAGVGQSSQVADDQADTPPRWRRRREEHRERARLGGIQATRRNHIISTERRTSKCLLTRRDLLRIFIAQKQPHQQQRADSWRASHNLLFSPWLGLLLLLRAPYHDRRRRRPPQQYYRASQQRVE